MTKEEEILHYIILNPYITQQELAEKVGLSRSAVANYIRALTNSGKIIGRAYIVRENEAIVCIGGMNIDRKASAEENVILHSSNPVHVLEVPGGVARNVAENLHRLQYNVSLLSAIGEDKEGIWLLEQGKESGLDVSKVWTLHSERTGSYTTLIDVTGETVVAMADMKIYNEITVDMVEDRCAKIENAKAVFLDTNVSKEVIQFIIAKCREEKIRLFITSSSSVKLKKLPFELRGVEAIILHKREVEYLFQLNLNKDDDYMKAIKRLKEMGVVYPVILHNHYTVYGEIDGKIQPITIHPYILKDETGMQEAFVSGLMYAILQENTLKDACYYGLCNMSLTAQTNTSVYPEVTAELLKKQVEKLGYNK